MKTHIECGSEIRIELPKNTDIQTISTPQGRARIGLIQSYRYKTPEEAEEALREIAIRINQALEDKN